MSTEYISYESLIAARQSAQWAFWAMIGTWVSGIATFLAVAVSLYLANRKSRPLINVSIDGCFINTGLQTISGVSITVANASEVNVVITGIYWEMRSSKKLAQMFDHPLSAKMPAKLAGGESVMFFIENDESDNWLKTMLSNIRECNGNVRKLNVCIHLASGVKVRRRAKEISSALLQIAKAV